MMVSLRLSTSDVEALWDQVRTDNRTKNGMLHYLGETRVVAEISDEGEVTNLRLEPGPAYWNKPTPVVPLEGPC